MQYRKLDNSGDMVFGHSSKDYLTDCAEAVAQSVLTRLRLWRGEWYLDTSEGTPYMQEILGKGTESSAVQALYKRVRETDGVESITNFQTSLDADTRQMKFEIEIQTEYGAITVNG
jgi:hypothetical protein